MNFFFQNKIKKLKFHIIILNQHIVRWSLGNISFDLKIRSFYQISRSSEQGASLNVPWIGGSKGGGGSVIWLREVIPEKSCSLLDIVQKWPWPQTPTRLDLLEVTFVKTELWKSTTKNYIKKTRKISKNYPKTTLKLLK